MTAPQMLDCLDTLAAQAHRQIAESQAALLKISELRSEVIAQRATVERITAGESRRRTRRLNRDFSLRSMAAAR